MTQWVYKFGDDQTEGGADMRNLLGGKGANLAEMASLNLPVPSGFTITTEVCTHYYDNEENYPSDLNDQVSAGIAHIEQAIGLAFGNAQNPLLVSVRSGARVSMPGMMDTVLNLGLNDESVEGLAKVAGDARFAWDSYRRFIQMYGDVVMGVDHHFFEDVIETFKRREGLAEDTQIDADSWRDIVDEFKTIIRDEKGVDFPQDPKEQLWGAIGAVFGSWMTPRAVTYRRINDIPADWGTAVNVQAMVFGNRGEDCATGVAFTRNPSTGDNEFYGEYLINAQGEDVVAGIRTPQPLDTMQQTMPVVYKQLCDVREKLEGHFHDMQDIEFTVQQDKLYMLQTRGGKRTAAAALKIACDMVEEKLITRDEALLRLDPNALDQLLHPTLDPTAKKEIITKGLPASPGAASGKIVFNADDAEKMANDGERVILCRVETSPEDIHGMHAAAGILTSRGGMTSHAAVVARGMGRACVAGAGSLHIDYKTGEMQCGDHILKEGETVTIDGGTGELMVGAIPTVEPQLSGHFATIMRWADETRRMKIRTNAETPQDAETAIRYGAQGIGLCRTEHMFFDPERIQFVREMIFAEDLETRENALAKLEPFQRADFVDLFKVMGDLPVTIRLLDPPLHEFLPQSEADCESFAKTAGLTIETVNRRMNELHEANPMLGHRGCRLGITYPEIYGMQARAIIAAAIETGAQPEIMIPLVATSKELVLMKDVVIAQAEKLFKETGKSVAYQIGTMIELPRAALMAEDIAKYADFFSFGTNDLTQTALGISRDDAGHFLPEYQAKGIYEKDPFVSLDIEGVGQLIRMACENGHKSNATLKRGICGEHGGDPASIAFCEEVGLDYVSCSPFRVPIARLSAAQATLRNTEKPQQLKVASN